jgi:hypothetical protein
LIIWPSSDQLTEETAVAVTLTVKTVLAHRTGMPVSLALTGADRTVATRSPPALPTAVHTVLDVHDTAVSRARSFGDR